METITDNIERGPRKTTRQRVLWIGKEIVIATVRYVIVTIIVGSLFLGGISCYGILVPDEVPSVSYMRSLNSLKYEARRNTSNLAQDWDASKGWDDIQKPLQILDVVCPEASAWVRDRHLHGKLVFEDSNKGRYAAYDYLNKILRVDRQMFSQVDGMKAATLAHEFRHSRQSMSVFCKSIAASMICNEYQPRIVEEDAELFEHKVIVAIFL